MSGALFEGASDARDDGFAASCAALGIPPDKVRARRAGPVSDDGLWPEHEEAVVAFLTVSTQMAVTGLDYAGARAGWDAAGTGMTPDLFAQVQLIEIGAIGAFQTRGG